MFPEATDNVPTIVVPVVNVPSVAVVVFASPLSANFLLEATDNVPTFVVPEVNVPSVVVALASPPNCLFPEERIMFQHLLFQKLMSLV